MTILVSAVESVNEVKSDQVSQLEEENGENIKAAIRVSRC